MTPSSSAPSSSPGPVLGLSVGPKPIPSTIDVPTRKAQTAATPRPVAGSAKKGGKASKGKVTPQQRQPVFRLLPIVIAGAALMLSVRLNDLRIDLSSIRVAGELQAQQTTSRNRPAAQQVAQAPQAQQQAAPAPVSAPPAVKTTAGGAGDQGNLSQTEMDVLQKLQERRNAMDVRERDLDRRESLLKAAESQIERKVTEMKTLQNTIQGLLRQYNEQEDSKMRSLVKIYENMKPKEAAKIFEQLDMGIMLEVVERMKEQRVAPILAEMDPVKARMVTSELAQRRQIPLPQSGQ